MKKIITLLASLCMLNSFVMASPVFAVNVFQACTHTNTTTTGTPDVCDEVKNQKANDNPIIDTLRTVINLVSLAVGIASVIIIVISGLRMVLDGGDPKAVEQARSGIIYALVGIAITAVAQAIVVFILNRF